MTDALYQEAIIAQARDRSHAGRLEGADGSAMIDNPLCGDRVTIDLRLDDGRIAAIAHKVRGCLLCEASASMLADRLEGASPDALGALEAAATSLLSGDGEAAEDWPALAIFAPVRPIKARHECVLLPFRAARAALEGATAPPASQDRP